MGIKTQNRSAKPVLIIQHAPHEHPAAIRRALESQGIRNLWLHPYKNDPFPKIEELSGIISLGGPMSANDEAEHPWIRPELDLLRQCVKSKKPFVGVCLGGQLMARALGAKVTKNPKAEVGWFPIELNDQGRTDPVLSSAGDNPLVYHFHNDTFEVPPGAVLLARSAACERQAYKLEEQVYGFQFHPEADHQLVHEWFTAEGFEDEIQAAREAHGSRTVQDAQTQLSRASQGEKSSLRITTSLTQLFRKEAYDPVKCSFQEQLEHWATLRIPVSVEFMTSDQIRFQIHGQIVNFLSIPSGDFVLLRGEDSILWPLRLDDILDVRPVSK